MLGQKIWLPILIAVFVGSSTILSEPQPLSESTASPAIVPEKPPGVINPTSTSTNPLFAEGVPEHLQCPQEWVGVRVGVLLGDASLEKKFEEHIEMYEDIIEKWNPNRPLSEIWDLVKIRKQDFLKPENIKVEVLTQFILDFPEMFDLGEEALRVQYMMDVELGRKDPDWNVAVLYDGRVFRMKANYKYQVRFTEVIEVESGREAVKSYELGPPDPSAPINGEHFIDLDVMTDDHIADMEGWNYNINPYTTNVPLRKIPPDFVNPTSTSTNPLFADGVPKHLQCPPELVGIYDIRIENRPFEVDPETFERIHQARLEILEKWNPNRPLTEVWPLFIAAEKRYKSNAVAYLAREGLGQERFDWQCQLTLDFPEIFALFDEDFGRAWNMRSVELGELSPDFNLLMLVDSRGRTRRLRTESQKKYVFTGLVTGLRRTYQHSPSHYEAVPEVISIDFDTITDEELEALQG